MASNDLEVRAQTVEEAVESGLAQLGLKRSDVIVDVIDEGSRGILGIGAREAVVRLVPMVTPPAASPAPPKPKAAKPKPAPTAVAPATTRPATAVAEGPTPEALAAEREMAVSYLQRMLQKMQVEAEIACELSEPDDLTGRQVNLIQIAGKDLGPLIGPRGDTLNALQFVTRLMIGHQMHQRADVIIDVEGYRERRKQALSRLAERMADKVIKRSRPVSLEPMPANERRIIHMTLRDNGQVYTQSTGEGNRRRVRILPKS